MHITTPRFELSLHSQPLFIMGPCVMENKELLRQTAEFLKELSEKLGFTLIFKSSFDKANRTSIDAFRGPGIEQGLEWISEIREEFDLPILSDIHTPEQAEKAGRVLDMLQIPAFLCRQTDLLVAAGQTGIPINLKKGQFVSPEDMAGAVKKIESTGNTNILLTERGTTFGYNNLVVDMRSIPIMHNLGHLVCYDATHSIQRPSGMGSYSGGDREFIAPLLFAAAGAGANAFFLEAHPDPDNALCDSKSMIAFNDLEPILEKVLQIRAIFREG